MKKLGITLEDAAPARARRAITQPAGSIAV